MTRIDFTQDELQETLFAVMNYMAKQDIETERGIAKYGILFDVREKIYKACCNK